MGLQNFGGTAQAPEHVSNTLLSNNPALFGVLSDNPGLLGVLKPHGYSLRRIPSQGKWSRTAHRCGHSVVFGFLIIVMFLLCKLLTPQIKRLWVQG